MCGGWGGGGGGKGCHCSFPSIGLRELEAVQKYLENFFILHYHGKNK